MPKYMVLPKTGSHFHRHRGGPGVHLRPGDTFEAEPYEVANFLDKIKRLSPIEEPQPETEERKLKIEERTNGLGYDVVNPVVKKTINSAPLLKEQAEELVDVSRRKERMEDTEDVGRREGFYSRGRPKSGKGKSGTVKRYTRYRRKQRIQTRRMD